MKNEKENSKNAPKAEGGQRNKLIIAAAALVIVLVVAYFYFLPNSGTQTPVPVPTQNQLSTPSAKLLLASYDSEAAMKEYSVAYTDTDSGGTLKYRIEKNATNGYVRVDGGFGSIMGFFGSNNTTDIICLDYGNTTRCAVTGVNAEAQGIANTLRVYLYDAKLDSALKAQTTQLVQAGVITFDSAITNEQVGPFQTQKISYGLDYSHLTLQQLSDLGLSNAQGLSSISNWKVAMWLDKATGLDVKSQASYESSGTQVTHNREYSTLALGSPKLPPVSGPLVSADAFVEFYQTSQADYSTILSCEPLAGADRDSCYKSAATARNDYHLCQKISDRGQFESCALIVASATNQSGYCQNLSISDDCYISVVGNTGDYKLCQNLKNASLGPVCSQAATQGKRLAEEAAASEQARLQGMNCNTNSDCKTAGNANQYCVAKSNPGPFQNDSSPEYRCLAGVQCGCNAGYCGFAKNDTYYNCISNYEEYVLQQFLIQKGAENATNSTSAGALNKSK